MRFRDPAPSRGAYKLQRLWLTPGFRLLLCRGLPMLVIVGALAAWIANPEHRLRIVEAVREMRIQIEARPEFSVRLMEITGTAPAVARELYDILPVDLPASSFDLDLAAIRAAAEALDVVASAEVRVRPAGVLEVSVTERIPAVVWRGRDRLELLDAEGRRVAGIAARAERPDLPLLAGEGAGTAVPEALDLIAVAGPLSDRIRGLLRVGQRRWDVILDRDQRVLLPETEPRDALARVIALDEVSDLLNRDVSVVDMRNPSRPTIRLGPEAAGTFRDARTSENSRQ